MSSEPYSEQWYHEQMARVEKRTNERERRNGIILSAQQAIPRRKPLPCAALLRIKRIGDAVRARLLSGRAKVLAIREMLNRIDEDLETPWPDDGPPWASPILFN